MSHKDSICQADLDLLLSDTFVQRVAYYSETESTNTRAVEMLMSGNSLDTPCLVYAESQVAGRGRGANAWWSASGSLTFSVIIDFRDFTLSVDQKPLLPLLTGMAVLLAGESTLPAGAFSLKWPNDVYLAGRKLAGVLIEVPSQSSDHAVIGVGLNVNNRFAQAPQDLRATSISLADQSDASFDRRQVLRSFMLNLEALLDSLAAGESFLRDWPRYCLLTGKRVTLKTGSVEVTGICGGIDPTGALVLQTDAGQQKFFGGVVQSWT